MATHKIISQLRDFFDSSKRKQCKEAQSLKELLKKLKKRKKNLEQKLDEEKDAKKRSLYAQEIKVVQAQRSKGIKILKKLCTR